jgi:hypothetical protein
MKLKIRAPAIGKGGQHPVKGSIGHSHQLIPHRRRTTEHSRSGIKVSKRNVESRTGTKIPGFEFHF